jgi:hypothetical protein
MGEAKARHLNGEANGHVPTSGIAPTPQRVRLVPNLRLETRLNERVVLLVLGDDHPELGSALTPDKARELARGLLKHADMIEPESRIVLP